LAASIYLLKQDVARIGQRGLMGQFKVARGDANFPNG
jgi:hypothetical protein